MNRKWSKISCIFIILVALISFIVPTTVIQRKLNNYGKLTVLNSYYYAPSTIKPTTTLNISSEIGDIEINYISPQQENIAQIDILFETSGLNLSGKSIVDLFIVTWENHTSINLTLSLAEDLVSYEILMNKVAISVNLRADVKFNIYTNQKEGNLDLNIPFGVNVNDISSSVLYGNISYNLYNCILEGNIAGIGNKSNIEIKTYNIQCTRDVLWVLKNNAGEIEFDIFQSTEMGANITAIGELETTAGRIRVIYKDLSSQIGSVVSLNHWEGEFPTQCSWSGFNYGVVGTTPRGYLFTSFNYPAQNNFNISLHANENDWQPYIWDLSSEPN